MEPYKDAATLRELYHGQELSQKAVAEKLGVTTKKVRYWMDKHDIETRRQGRQKKEYGYPLDDRQELKRLYQDEKMSSSEIAEKYGHEQGVVGSRLDTFGIETRSLKQALMNRGKAGYEVSPNGYPRIHTTDNDGHMRVQVHQLLAIAEGADPHEIFSNGEYQVHHKNGIKWDNRPSNIEVLTLDEHADRHSA